MTRSSPAVKSDSAPKSPLDLQPRVEKSDVGIEQREKKHLAEGLSQSLADTFSLYVKTLGVHWNVVGPSFYGLHKLTEVQYQDLAEAVDALAERIRALGYPAPAGFADFRSLSAIEAESRIEGTGDMLKELIADNELAARRMRKVSDLAAEAEDKFSEDMLIGRMGAHEKNVWMLRALVAQ
ncbi:MAG TPA: DNA starvation/stationary phase protection protein [Parvibaculum sp.]